MQRPKQKVRGKGNGEGVKVLAVMPLNWHSSLYMFNVLKELPVDRVTPTEYLGVDQSGYDALIYNTFPVEDHRKKFNWDLIQKTDEKFWSFDKARILFDTHDSGSKDGFARFSAPLMPRIKLNPSYDMMKKMNIIMTVPFQVHQVHIHPRRERPIRVLSAMRVKGMPYGRKHVNEKIAEFNPVTEWLGLRGHLNRLGSVLINVVPNGTGDSPRSCADSLAAGALLLAEEGIDKIKILPFADLVPGEDFITFNLDNVCDKLQLLLDNPGLVDNVRLSGMQKFQQGYNLTRSTNQLVGWLNSHARN